MGIPANPIRPGRGVSGRISWFGGPHDSMAGSTTASGRSTSIPGIALYNRATLGGYFLVTAPNGRKAILQQTDLGPAPWTGRAIDFTYSSLGKLGYSEGNFPTNARASAVYLGKTIPKNYQNLVRGGGNGPQARGQTVTKTTGGLSVTPVSYKAVTKHGFDSVNYNADVGRTIAGNYIASATDPFSAGAPKTGITKGSIDAPLFQSGALSTQMPNPSDYATAQTQLERIAGRPVTSHPVTVVSGGGHYAPGNAHGYVNPLPGASFSRTDMGVDGTSRVFRAPADSRILVSNASDSGWRGGGYIAGVILNGPDKGKVWYAAEGLSPHVHVGQIVRAGGQIASPRPNPYNGISGNFEWGWAMRSQPGTPLAHGVYTEGAVTAAGRDFRRWLHSLGAHTG